MESKQQLLEIQKHTGNHQKENSYLKKYFKDFGPTKLKILQKEKQVAELELEELKKQIKKLKRS